MSHKVISKPYIISIAGPTPQDTIEIISDLCKEGFSGLVEINTSCPNLCGKGLIGYDPTDLDRYLHKLSYFFNYHMKIPFKIGLKLPPYFDITHFEATAKVINYHNFVSFVTCINSPGLGLIIDPDTNESGIIPNHGLGGIGGKYVKPFALSNVKTFRRLLREDIDIIGCGGVTCGRDVYEHLLCGAKAVQVGTQLMKEGPQVFERLTRELKDILCLAE